MTDLPHISQRDAAMSISATTGGPPGCQFEDDEHFLISSCCWESMASRDVLLESDADPSVECLDCGEMCEPEWVSVKTLRTQVTRHEIGDTSHQARKEIDEADLSPGMRELTLTPEPGDTVIWKSREHVVERVGAYSRKLEAKPVYVRKKFVDEGRPNQLAD